MLTATIDPSKTSRTREMFPALEHIAIEHISGLTLGILLRISSDLDLTFDIIRQLKSYPFLMTYFSLLPRFFPALSVADCRN